MAMQIKKKFLKDDSVDGSKIKLLKDQALRGQKQDGSEVNLLELGANDELLSDGQEVAFVSQVEAEASNRVAGDASLQNSVEAEASSRVAGDASLQNSVEAEASSRIAGDQAEASLRTVAVDSEASSRVAGDASLQSNIDAEASSRIAGDASLQDYAEEIDGYAQDVADDLQAETSNRIIAIDSEASSRVAGDESLQSQIDFIVENTDPAALDSLTEIVSAFQAMDGELSGAIAALGSGSSSAIGAEASTRAFADASLQSNIDAEASSRIASDESLQTAIDSEASSRIVAETSLQDSIDAEVSTLTLNKVDKAGDEMSGNLTMTGTDGVVLGSQGLEIYGNGLESPVTVTFNKDMLFMEQYGQSAELRRTGLYFDSGLYNISLDQSGLSWNFYEGNSTSIGRGEFNFTSSFETETGISHYTMSLYNGGMPSIVQDLTDGVQNPIPFVPTEDQHIVVKKYVDDQDTALSDRLDVLEAQAFNKEKFIIDQTSELTSVELAHEVVENSLVVCVGRLMVQKDEDYTVSVVGGVTVLTWIGDFATDGVEAIENGDVIFVTYAY
jgi:hypothetical protein